MCLSTQAVVAQVTQKHYLSWSSSKFLVKLLDGDAHDAAHHKTRNGAVLDASIDSP